MSSNVYSNVYVSPAQRYTTPSVDLAVRQARGALGRLEVEYLHWAIIGVFSNDDDDDDYDDDEDAGHGLVNMEALNKFLVWFYGKISLSWLYYIALGSSS